MTQTVAPTEKATEPPTDTATESVTQTVTTVDTATGTATVTVEVRAFAAARAALGWAQRTESMAPGATVADVVGRVGAQAPDATAVLERCAVLFDGRRVSDLAGTAVRDGARLDLLPPFAGG